MLVHDVPLLQCPESRAPLRFHGTNLEGRLQDGVLVCDHTNEAWAVELGLPNLCRPAWRTGSDAAAAAAQDAAPQLLEPVFALSSLLMGSGRAAGLRDKVARALRLRGLGKGRRARVLELNVGTGAHIEPGFDQAGPDADLHWWGASLSVGALRTCAERVARNPGWEDRVSLLLADAHHLPLATGAFDRVLMVGAVDCLREPRRALAELARVCAPDGEVVLIDKHIDPSRSVNPLARGVAAALGRAASQPQRPPTAELPTGCRKVEVEELSPVHYLLRFQPPRR